MEQQPKYRQQDPDTRKLFCALVNSKKTVRS